MLNFACLDATCLVDMLQIHTVCLLLCCYYGHIICKHVMDCSVAEHLWTCFAAHADNLAWPEDTAIPYEQYIHLHSLAEPALLKALVQQILPSVTPGSNATSEASLAVHSLCQMLQTLTGVSALCQKALIFMAYQADFVQRLWFSYLQVSRNCCVILCMAFRDY